MTMLKFAMWLTASHWRIALWCLTWMIIGAGLFAAGVAIGIYLVD